MKNFILVTCLASMVALVGCSKLDAIEKTGPRMDDMNSKMSHTNSTLDQTSSAIHDQQIIIPYQEMLKEQNWEVLAPVPFRLLPYGKKVGEALHEDELINLVYLMLREVREAKVSKGMDPLTGEDAPWSAEEVRGVFREKQALTTICQIISGFAPETVIDEVIQKEITGDDSEGARRFEATAYELLEMRARFISDVLLKNSLLAERIINMGQIEKAIEYVQQVDRLGRMDFTSKIDLHLTTSVNYLPAGSTESTALDIDLSDKFNFASEMPALWNKVKFLAENVHPENNTGVSAASIDAEKARKERALQTINQALHVWGH